MTTKDSGFFAKVRHAFAVDDPQGPEPTAQEQDAVEWVTRQLHRYPSMTMPIQVVLHSCRPLNYVAAQAGHLFSPVYKAVASTFGHSGSYVGYQQFLEFLGRRGSLEYLSDRLGDLHAEHEARKNPAPTTKASANAPEDGKSQD